MKISRIKHIILILFISISNLSFAQTFKKYSTRYAVDAQYHYGITIPHHTNMIYLVDDYTRGFELSLIKHNFSNNGWEQYFNFPETGIGFWYNTFGRKDIFGNGYAIFPYINFNILQWQNLSLKYKVALGLGYADKPFHPIYNSKNNVFGSHINAYIGFALKANYRITDNISLLASLSLNHMSNGSSKKPNNGINTASLTGGVVYDFVTYQNENKIKQKPPKSNTREIISIISLGKNQPVVYNSKKYISGTASIAHLWHTNKIKAYGIGAEVFRFGGAPYAWEAVNEIDINHTYGNKDYLFAGTYGTMETYLGNSTIFISVGAYIYKHTTPLQPVYARLGIRYKIYDNFVANFGIKANFFTAEFIEFGIGYRWKYKS